MDLDIANKQFNLRFKDLLEAEDFNFSHDIVGIQNHIYRQTKQFTGLFLPRFASRNM